MVAIINAGTSTPPPTLGASPEQKTVGNTFSQNTLTKADKLEIAYVRDAAAVEPATLATKTPDEISPQPPSSTATPKIASRHWHGPNTKKSAAVSPGRRIKSQEPKQSKNVDRGKATVDLRTCRRPEGFAGLLRALNLSPGCDT
jgi:hypothetical protein